MADIVEIGRPVVQDDDRQASVAVSQKLIDRFLASGPSVVPADEVKSVVDFFHGVLKEVDPSLIKKRHRAGTAQIMISRDSVDAVFRLQAAELSFELVQLLAPPIALEHITSDQNNIRVRGIDLFDKPLHETPVGRLPEMKISDEADFQLTDLRRFTRDLDRIRVDLRLIIPHSTNHDDGHGHRQNQKKPGLPESSLFHSLLGQDPRQPGHAKSEIQQDDEKEEVQKERQRKIAGDHNKIGPFHARSMGQHFGKREGQYQKNIDGNEKDLEKILRDQLPDAKTGIDDQRCAE